MSGGGSDTTTTVQNSSPWEESIPYLKDIMGGAQDLYNSGQGFGAYPGNTVVPFSGQTSQALSGIEGMANAGNPLGQAAQGQTLDVLNSGGMSDWQKQALGGAYDVAQGNNQINAVSGNLGATAAGDYLGGRNPYFEQNLNTQSGQLADDINRSMDMMGRRASPAAGNAVAQGVGDFRNKAMQDNYNQERQLQMQAVNMLGQEQGSNIANQVNAGQGIFGAGNQAGQLAAQYAGLSPSVYEQQYQPMERLASVGAQNEDLATRQLQAQMDQYNINQQQPWNQLSAYSALAGGTGQLGGTSTGTVSTPSSYNYASPLGGALAGGSMFGIPGAIGGGILGLLGGF